MWSLQCSKAYDTVDRGSGAPAAFTRCAYTDTCCCSPSQKLDVQQQSFGPCVCESVRADALIAVCVVAHRASSCRPRFLVVAPHCRRFSRSPLVILEVAVLRRRSPPPPMFVVAARRCCYGSSLPKPTRCGVTTVRWQAAGTRPLGCRGKERPPRASIFGRVDGT